MEPVGLWLIAGAAALLAYGSYRSKRQRSDELEVLASELGLRVGEDEGLSGEFNGIAIRMWSQVHEESGNGLRYTYIEAVPSDVLPAGFRIEQEGFFSSVMGALGMGDIRLDDPFLDSRLLVKGDDPDRVRAVLASPGVHQHLTTIARARCLSHFDQSSLSLRLKGDHVNLGRKWVVEATALLASLARNGVGQWPGVATQLGLELDEDRSRMAGEVDGVKIRIAMVEADWRASTVLSADLLEPLPAGTRIYKRTHPSDPKVGDLILDSGIAVACEDLAVLRRRLGTDDARAVLMEVIHGARGEIRYDKIRIEWSGRAGPELVPAVHQVVELAQALAVLPH